MERRGGTSPLASLRVAVAFWPYPQLRTPLLAFRSAGSRPTRLHFCDGRPAAGVWGVCVGGWGGVGWGGGALLSEGGVSHHTTTAAITAATTAAAATTNKTNTTIRSSADLGPKGHHF